MAVSLLYKRQAAKIGTLELDAALTETHSADVEVTEYPVEQGANVADHRRVKPISITLECIISNTPMPKDGDPNATVSYRGHTWQSRSKGQPGRAELAYEELLDLKNSAELLTVVTSLKTYDNMTITSVSVPRDEDTVHALRFTVTLREIRVVRNDTVTISAKTTRAKPKTDLHKKAKTETTPEQQKQSFLRYLTEGDAKRDAQNAIESLTKLAGGG
jgi:hypothetical protein